MILNCEQINEVVFHFNKMCISDNTIPMWVVKHKGKTYYVDHVDVSSGVGFSTKETPDNKHTKGSIKIKGCVKIFNEENKTIVNIF
jgi:hypothetical protein